MSKPEEMGKKETFFEKIQWDLHEWSPLNNSHLPITASFQNLQIAVNIHNIHNIHQSL